MKKPLNKDPARLQRMICETPTVSFQSNLKRGPTLHLADILSRAPLTHPVTVDVTSFDAFRVEMEHLGQQRNPGLTENIEHWIREKTRKDEILKELHHVINRDGQMTKQKSNHRRAPIGTIGMNYRSRMV